MTLTYFESFSIERFKIVGCANASSCKGMVLQSMYHYGSFLLKKKILLCRLVELFAFNLSLQKFLSSNFD